MRRMFDSRRYADAGLPLNSRHLRRATSIRFKRKSMVTRNSNSFRLSGRLWAFPEMKAGLGDLPAKVPTGKLDHSIDL